MSGEQIVGQTMVQRCDFCGEPSETEIVIEPSRKISVNRGGETCSEFIAERRAWVWHTHAAVAQGGPVKPPRGQLAPGTNRFGGRHAS